MTNLDVSLRLKLLNEVSGPAKTAERDLAALRNAAARLNGTVGGALSGELRAIAAPAQAATRGVLDLKGAADRLGQSAGPASLDRMLDRLGQTSLRTGADLGRAAREADRLGATAGGTQRLETALDRVGRRPDEARRKLAAVGGGGGGGGGAGGGRGARFADFGRDAMAAINLGAAARVGLAVGGPVGIAAGTAAIFAPAATRQAMSFGKAMAEVKMAVSDLSPEGVKALEAQILRLSASTGIAKERLAELAAQGAYLRVPGQDLARFAADAAKVGTVFKMTGEDAARSGGELAKFYKLDAAGIRDAFDIAQTVGQQAGIERQKVLKFMTEMGPTAQVRKITPAQAAALSAGGVDAGEVDSLIGKLADAPRHAKDVNFQKGLWQLGRTDWQTRDSMRQDSYGGLLQMLERLKALPKNQQLVTARDIAGSEEGALKILAMVAALEKIPAAMRAVADPAHRGAVDRAFSIFNAATNAKIDRAGAAIDALKVRIGRGFTPAVDAAADAVWRWLNGLEKAAGRAEQVYRIAPKVLQGQPLDPAEQNAVEADPRVKASIDARRRLRLEQLRRELDVHDSVTAGRRARDPDAPDNPDSARKRQGIVDEMARLRSEMEKRSGLGSDKRSELPDAARRSFAAYHEEVKRGEDRVLRTTEAFARDMRAALAIGARPEITPAVLTAGDRFGGAQLSAASLGSSPGRLGSGRVGLSRYAARGAVGTFTTPGRFGGLVRPSPGAGQGAIGGTANGMPGVEASPGLYKAALDHIAKAEGTAGRGDYNASLGYGRFLPGGKEQNLTGKSLNEILALGRHMRQQPGNPNSSALGRYQIVGDTLRRLMTRLGLSGEEKFDEKMQDRLGAELFKDTGGNPGRLGKEWASLRGEKLSQAVALAQQARQAGAQAATGQPGTPGENGQFDPLGGAARRFTSPFGMRNHPVVGGRRMHWGQDMAAPAGTAVHAMQGGRVSAVNAHGDVTVTHPDGSTKTYRHIVPQAGLISGQEVSGGQAIGALRAHDPRSTGPHLHLEATDPQGRRIDPMEQIRAAARAGAGPVALDRRKIERVRQRFEPLDDTNTLSPRFAEPPSARAADLGEAAGARSGRRGRAQGPPAQIVQNFHGGFDAASVARRAQLEQNRAIRQVHAGALHDIGGVA